MNWSLIILGLVAVSSVSFAENSYLVIAPKLFKVGYENQVSVFIAAASQPVEVRFDLAMGQQHIEGKVMCKPGETRNATMTLPKEFPVGAGLLTMTGTGGIRFEEKRDIIVYDNRHIMLVQTSASTYCPGDTMEVRVVATSENLIPIESGELMIEIYDADLKLVGEFPRIPIRSGLTETLRFPVSEHVNVGTWLVSATMDNTTSSVEVLVARPITPSFDLKAIFQRFLLRTDKTLRGVIEINSDRNEPIFGRATIAIGQITEQELESTMRMTPKPREQQPMNEEWRKWKSQEVEIAGRIELNYDLLSLFNVDVTKALAVQVYIKVIDLISGQERVIRHVIPVFTRDVIYDIRPLEFEAGIKNEFEIIAKRPDGKPTKMEDMIVTIRMIMDKQQEEKSVEIKDFYTRGRNDIGLFNIEIPENCMGVLMTITPLGEDGKVRGYRTHAVPLMPKPRHRGTSNAKLSIELSPSTVAPVHTDVNVPVISSQISTVGRMSNFYVQLIPSKPVEKFEPLPMSYVLMTNGRIIRTGEFNIEPTKECRTKTARTIQPEVQTPPACVFNGTLPILITRDMIPYSTLLVYTFQPSFGFNVAESYRFSVAGLFQSTFTLNATIVPFKTTETMTDASYYAEETMMKPMPISNKVQDRTRVELSFTGVPDSTVGLNVFEYDGLLQGLSDEITKERLLKYLTTYEQVPLVSMPTMPSTEQSSVMKSRTLKETEDHSSEESHEHKDWKMPSKPDHFHSEMEEHDMYHTPRPEEVRPDMKGTKEFKTRRLDTEEQEEERINRERKGYKMRYPIEQMIFGVCSSRSLPLVEGDDVYTTSNMERLYGDEESRRTSSSHYRRRLEKSWNQYDVTIGENGYVIATSMPLALTAGQPMTPKPEQERNNDMEMNYKEEPMREEPSQYGTPSWYERMNTKLNAISQEAFTFMRSGLTIVSDFDSLRIPTHMRRENLTKLFYKFHEQSRTFMDRESFDVRDEARMLLEEYLVESDSTMVPPPIMFEEQARSGYYRSIFFNTSRIESQGTGKVVLPRTKPYSTWLATGFALNSKSGLAIAQPIRLPTNTGLYVLGNCPQHVQISEHVLFTYGINNYLGKDLTNVKLRIRASADFDLMENTQIVSSSDKDYTFIIPSLKSFGVEIRNMTLVPKRAGVIQILIEVESEFGGDYEVMTVYVRESGIERTQYAVRLFDLTSDKKTYGPIVEKITPSPFLKSVRIAVASTGLDRLVEHYSMETNSLMGIDRALVRLYRALGLRRYLNETLQRESPLFNMTTMNITKAYQKLQLYNDYDGSYSFISDQGTPHSSLYLTSFAFGAMISPMMPFRDNVTLNRTLNWILSRQQEDGSFFDDGLCLHYRYCSGEFRRESLTALVVYSFTRDNSVAYMPEFIRRRLFDGERSPMMRAQRYLESRVTDVKPHLLTITLFEMAFMQNGALSSMELREKVHKALLARQLTVVPEDSSRYLKNMDDKMTFDDQLLVNSMTLSLYAKFDDFKTSSDMARWVVSQLNTHPHYDTVLDAVFRVDAWINTDCLFRKHFGTDKVSFTVDVTADRGQKQQFTFDGNNMDITQRFEFTLPVQEISYTVTGFGLAFVRIEQMYVEQEQKPMESVPFKLTNEFMPMSWISEIKTKTCMTYTPTTRDQQLFKDFNRTIVVEVKIPSGMRINMRQIGFFLSRVEELMYFMYKPHENKLVFFINVPSTVFGKPICFEWCLERLSTVISWAPVYVRAYDYLQQETQLARLIPIQLQPSVLGWSYVEAVHKARPSLEQLANLQKQSSRV